MFNVEEVKFESRSWFYVKGPVDHMGFQYSKAFKTRGGAQRHADRKNGKPAKPIKAVEPVCQAKLAEFIKLGNLLTNLTNHHLSVKTDTPTWRHRVARQERISQALRTRYNKIYRHLQPYKRLASYVLEKRMAEGTLFKRPGVLASVDAPDWNEARYAVFGGDHLGWVRYSKLQAQLLRLARAKFNK